MNINDQFKSGDLASPYNAKQNLNAFFEELSSLAMKNILLNEKLGRFVYPATSGTPVDWNLVGTGSATYVSSKEVTGTLAVSSSFRQKIDQKLYPNTRYTCIIYSDSSEDIRFSVTATASNQIFEASTSVPHVNLLNTAYVQSSPVTAMTKYYFQFDTNSTAISGDIYFNIQNTSSSAQADFSIRYISLYQGNVEFGETPDNSVPFAEKAGSLDPSALVEFATSATYAVSALYAVNADTGGSDSVSAVVPAGSAADLIYAQMASSDYFRLRVGGSTDAGYVEYALADNASEGMYFRQYSASGGNPFGTITRTATLLDSSGNTTLPGQCNAASFNATSKRELKENIEDFTESALDIIDSIDVVSFNFIADESKEYKVGFIADDTNPILSGADQTKMDVNNCIGLLLKAVQELKKENEELKKLLSN